MNLQKYWQNRIYVILIKFILGGTPLETTLRKYIEVASKKPADLVIKHAKIVNVFTKEIMEKM